MTGKNKTVLLDTNVIIRYLLNDHKELSKKANNVFELIAKGNLKAIILESVFTECIFILSKVYLIPKNKIVLSLSSLLYYKGIINDNKHILRAALDLFNTTNIHIVDCILVAHSKNNNYDLITFDKQLQNVNH